MPNTYVDLGTYQRAYINNQVADASDALEMLRIIETASRAVDGYCRRHFYCLTLTRYLNPRDRFVCEIDDDRHPDLLSLASVAVDTGYDRTYATSLVLNTDYELSALDEDDDSVAPFNALRLLPGGTLGAWPISGAINARYYNRIVRVSGGVWGYSNDSEAVLTSAGAAVTGTLSDASDTTLATSAVAYPEIAPGMTLVIGSEQIYVVSGSASPFVVLRGVNGTSAAAHAAVAIRKATYPAVVVDATAMWAARLYARRQTPMFPHFVIQSPGVPLDRLAQALDPDIEMILYDVRRVAGLG